MLINKLILAIKKGMSVVKSAIELKYNLSTMCTLYLDNNI